MEYDNLQELTGNESGAILYDDAEVIILNWSSVEGLPRGFVIGYIGLAEKITAKRIATPPEVIHAMKEHEKDQGTEVSKNGWKSWRVNNSAIVTINWRWN
jgi:hypothetical protein